MFSRVLRIRGLTAGLKYIKPPPPSEDISKRRIVKAKRVLDKLRQQMEARNNDAAKTISRFWLSCRHRSTKRLIMKFMQAGLMRSSIRQRSFQDLVLFLREQGTISITKNLLHRFHQQALAVHEQPVVPGMQAIPQVNVRVFLASLMIDVRSGDVFEQMGALERKVKDASTALLNRFEELIIQFIENNRGFSGTEVEARSNFVRLLFEYLVAFRDWKVPDEAKLAARLRHALIALHQATAMLPSDEPADSRIKVELRTQTTRLRNKLLQISGPTAVAAIDAEIRSGNFEPAAVAAGGARSGGRLGAALDNEGLAHQVLLDPTFQLQYAGEGSGLDDRMRQVFYDTFWVSVQDDLELQPPVYTRFLRLIREIRDGLVDTGNMGAMAIDVDFIQQQAVNGAFNQSDIIAFGQQMFNLVLISLLPVHIAESRIRWGEIRALMESVPQGGSLAAPITKMCRFLLDSVSYVRIDHANARYFFLDFIVL